MTAIRKFFTTSELSSTLRELAFRYQDPSPEDAKIAGNLAFPLTSMVSAGDEWDGLCQYTIKKYGGAFQIAVSELRTIPNPENLKVVKALTYVFLTELDLSMETQLEDPLREFKDSVEKEFRGQEDRAGIIVSVGAVQLPIAIIKHALNAPGIGNFKDVGHLSSLIEDKVGAWTEQLTAHERKVDELKANLEKQEHAYNFVGLNQGFSDLERKINDELKKQRRNMLLFGALMLCPALIDLVLMVLGKIEFSSAKLSALIGGAAVSLTCTLIFLYFFRIVLRDVDSKDAQLVQVRLRMTLCQFIQSYATYASEIRLKNPEVLSKFESLIFSGIVGTQDKLPSTFDGLEQLGALLKTAKG